MLLEAGADKDAATMHGVTVTALHIAAREGHLEVVRLLLQAGADKDASNGDGLTALHFAARPGHSEVVRLLLEAGADKDAATTHGVTVTALHIAAQEGHLEVVRLLLEAGADKDTADTNGWTALHFAAEDGHLEVCDCCVKLELTQMQRMQVQLSCKIYDMTLLCMVFQRVWPTHLTSASARLTGSTRLDLSPRGKSVRGARDTETETQRPWDQKRPTTSGVARPI